jgi:hypothetical protein
LKAMTASQRRAADRRSKAITPVSISLKLYLSDLHAGLQRIGVAIIL